MIAVGVEVMLRVAATTGVVPLTPDEGGGGGLSTFSGWSSRAGWALAIVLTGIVAAGLATVIVSIRQRDLARHRPTWRRIAQRLGLSREERRLVQAMAVAVGEVHPVSVLMSEGTFEEAMRRHAARSGGGGAMERLRRRVFSAA